ncbi:unnamed protein product, partial [marine sediment metagenome]
RGWSSRQSRKRKRLHSDAFADELLLAGRSSRM